MKETTNHHTVNTHQNNSNIYILVDTDTPDDTCDQLDRDPSTTHNFPIVLLTDDANLCPTLPSPEQSTAYFHYSYASDLTDNKSTMGSNTHIKNISTVRDIHSNSPRTQSTNTNSNKFNTWEHISNSHTGIPDTVRLNIKLRRNNIDIDITTCKDVHIPSTDILPRPQQYNATKISSRKTSTTIISNQTDETIKTLLANNTRISTYKDNNIQSCTRYKKSTIYNTETYLDTVKPPFPVVNMHIAVTISRNIPAALDNKHRNNATDNDHNSTDVSHRSNSNDHSNVPTIKYRKTVSTPKPTI